MKLITKERISRKISLHITHIEESPWFPWLLVLHKSTSFTSQMLEFSIIYFFLWWWQTNVGHPWKPNEKGNFLCNLLLQFISSQKSPTDKFAQLFLELFNEGKILFNMSGLFTSLCDILPFSWLLMIYCMNCSYIYDGGKIYHSVTGNVWNMYCCWSW